MTIKSVGVFSIAKVAAILYAALGLVFGMIMSLVNLVTSGIFGGTEQPPEFVGLLFGTWAVVFLPVFYGLIGFFGGAIASWLYNIVAPFVGGVEVTFGSEESVSSPVEY